MRKGRTGGDGGPWVEIDKPKPPRVDDHYRYWGDPPPELSERCRYWLAQIDKGWRPPRRPRQRRAARTPNGLTVPVVGHGRYSRGMTSTVCRGCGQPVRPGFFWHQPCLQAERGRVGYREATLARDGFACTRCPDLWNRAVLSWYGGRLLEGGGLSVGVRNGRLGRLPVLRRQRRVEVDHNDPLASATGTNDPTNMQVLCRRHHKAKTRVDVARLRGRRVPIPRARLVVAVVAVLLVWRAATHLSLTAVAALLVLALIAAGRAWTHRRVLDRLYAAVNAEIKSGPTRRRQLRGTRWRYRRVPGLQVPRLRPTRLELRYPHTVDDADPAVQERVERRLAAKCGGTWAPGEWRTGADRVVMSSPDPLVGRAAVPWPNAGIPNTSLWEPVPVMLDERGRTMTMSLVGKNALIGGEPEAGKSAFMSMLVASAALDPETELLLIDGKGLVEFGIWERSAAKVACDMDGAMAISQYVKDLIDLRYESLREEQHATGKPLRKITEDDGMGLVVVAIDELAEFTAGGKKADRDAFNEITRSNVSRGRACGVIYLCATQRPSANIIPTDLRDLISYRVAMRCNTPQASDMILGQGWASQGFSAAKISSETRGIGYVHADGSRPRRGRGFLIDDGTLEVLAGRAARLRAAGDAGAGAEGLGAVGGVAA